MYYELGAPVVEIFSKNLRASPICCLHDAGSHFISDKAKQSCTEKDNSAGHIGELYTEGALFPQFTVNQHSNLGGPVWLEVATSQVNNQ